MATLGSDMLVSCSVGNLQVVSSGGTLPYRNMCSAVSSCSSLSMVYTVAAKGLGSGLVRNISGLTGRARASGRFRYGNLQDAKWGSLRNRNHRFLPISAKGTDDSLSPSEMTLETALKLLGVGEGASFDEILGAKKSLVDSCGGDMDRISQVRFLFVIVQAASYWKLLMLRAYLPRRFNACSQVHMFESYIDACDCSLLLTKITIAPY